MNAEVQHVNSVLIKDIGDRLRHVRDVDQSNKRLGSDAFEMINPGNNLPYVHDMNP